MQTSIWCHPATFSKCLRSRRHYEAIKQLCLQKQNLEFGTKIDHMSHRETLWWHSEYRGIFVWHSRTVNWSLELTPLLSIMSCGHWMSMCLLKPKSAAITCLHCVTENLSDNRMWEKSFQTLFINEKVWVDVAYRTALSLSHTVTVIQRGKLLCFNTLALTLR